MKYDCDYLVKVYDCYKWYESKYLMAHMCFIIMEKADSNL
jgi:hypothetical protein